MRMFQGFMALGLFTGIAALGVIAFRSVVERRQQIGMLRAIGYQSGTVSLTFMLESGFIALMGILSGVVGGMIIARNLMTSEEFGSGIPFAIPWAEVLIMAGAAFFFSMFMTWWPSRQAAKVPVADALRYE
jgi:putative ABC transport system permease protein